MSEPETLVEVVTCCRHSTPAWLCLRRDGAKEWVLIVWAQDGDRLRVISINGIKACPGCGAILDKTEKRMKMVADLLPQHIGKHLQMLTPTQEERLKPTTIPSVEEPEH